MKLHEAGVGSATPATVALTLILCLPGFSDGAVKGERHALKALLSTLQVKVALPPVALNLIVGVRSWVFAGGFEVILVSGGGITGGVGITGGGVTTGGGGGAETAAVVNT